MNEKINATCSICGNGYHLCLSCKDAMNLHPWKIHCCSADCYKVFQMVRGFSTGVYTKNEFKSKLKNIDLNNLENYRDHIRDLIKDTLKEDEIVAEKVSQIEEEIIIEKPIYSRKKNYRTNNEIKEADVAE